MIQDNYNEVTKRQYLLVTSGLFKPIFWSVITI